MDKAIGINFRRFLINQIDLVLKKYVWPRMLTYGLKYYDTKEDYVYYKAIVPSKMICPCKKCGCTFNLGDNYICQKDRSGSPRPDICFSCFGKDNTISIWASFSVHDCEIDPAHLPTYV